jgi:hypothetical protein
MSYSKGVKRDQKDDKERNKHKDKVDPRMPTDNPCPVHGRTPCRCYEKEGSK